MLWKITTSGLIRKNVCAAVVVVEEEEEERV